MTHAPTTRAETVDDRIVRAALACFRARGVTATSMGDIAEAAGMARPQLYRHVAGKEALIVRSLVRQARRLSEERLRRFPISGPVAPLIVRTLLVGHRELLADEFAHHLMAGGGVALTLRLLSTSDELREAQRTWWRPVIAHGRDREEIRPDLGEDEIIDWFLLSQIEIAEHADHHGSDEDVRRHLERFIVPAVTGRAPA